MRYKIQVTVMSLFVSLALTACGQSEAKTAQRSPATNANTTDTSVVSSANAETTKIVFLGDSLTAGFGLPQEQAWPEQVQKRLISAGYKTKVVNAGVSGDNSANGLARYDWSVGSIKADMLILALGANDFLQGVSPVTTRRNLKAIIERAQADGMEVILVGVEIPDIEGLDSILQAYGEIYPDLAQEYNLSFFSSMLEDVSDRPELLQSDGLHPTKAGVEIMADRFADYLRTQLDP